MQRPDAILADYHRIEVVSDLTGLFNAKFNPVNCVLLPRTLSGDFNGLARRLYQRLGLHSDVHTISAADFAKTCDLAKIQGNEIAAADAILDDVAAIGRRLDDIGKEARLNSSLIFRVIGSNGYGDNDPVGFYHEDEVLGMIGRLMCSYNEPVTEALRNEDARLIGGRRYEKKDGAVSIRFAPGDITRHPGFDLDAEPFIHRARKGAPRIMLVGGIPPYQPPRY